MATREELLAELAKDQALLDKYMPNKQYMGSQIADLQRRMAAINTELGSQGPGSTLGGNNDSGIGGPIDITGGNPKGGGLLGGSTTGGSIPAPQPVEKPKSNNQIAYEQALANSKNRIDNDYLSNFLKVEGSGAKTVQDLANYSQHVKYMGRDYYIQPSGKIIVYGKNGAETISQGLNEPQSENVYAIRTQALTQSNKDAQDVRNQIQDPNSKLYSPETAYIDRQFQNGNADFNKYAANVQNQVNQGLAAPQATYQGPAADKVNAARTTAVNAARSNLSKDLIGSYARQTNQYQDLLNRNIRNQQQQQVQDAQTRAINDAARKNKNAALIGLLGTAIGGYFGGPTGAAIGGAAGSYAGSEY